MKITIIVPFYKNIHFLERLFHSLSFAIAQTHFEFELIVLIDSIETKCSVVEALYAHCLNEVKLQVQFKLVKNAQNIGVAATRNIGIEMATGEWIHLIDQDDTISPQFYSQLKKFNSFDFILFNGLFVFENGFQHAIYLLKPKLNLPHLIVNDFIRSPGQVLLKKEIINEVKFRTSKCAKGCDDRFFWIELFAQNQPIKAFYCHQKMYQAAIHFANYGSDVRGLYACSIELWQSVQSIIPSNYQYLVKQNLALLSYLVQGKKSWENRKAYLKYQLNLNKLLRFLFKKTGQFVLQMNPSRL